MNAAATARRQAEADLDAPAAALPLSALTNDEVIDLLGRTERAFAAYVYADRSRIQGPTIGMAREAGVIASELQREILRRLDGAR